MSRHTAVANDGELLGVSRYFTVRRINGNRCLQADGKSFHCLVCTVGEGSVGKTPIKAGHSVFVPADYGAYEISGDMELLLCEVRKYYMRIDLGDAAIKGGVVDDLDRMIVTGKVATESEGGAARIAENIACLTRELLSRVNLTAEDVVGLDIGVPDPVDNDTGEGVCASGLGKNSMVCDELSRMLGIPTRLVAPGEVRFI